MAKYAPRKYDDTKTEIKIEKVEYPGTKESNKDVTYKGVKITLGDTSLVVFPRRAQMAHIEKVLEANK